MARRTDISTAVIGSGFIGTVHIEALRRIGVNVVGLLGSSGPRGQERAEAVGVRHAYDSLDDLCADQRVQVVHVTSPNELHYPQVRQILAAGKHVICEKPLAMTSDESADLVRLAAESGLVNAVNFNIRFYPLNQHAHEIVGDGAGDVFQLDPVILDVLAQLLPGTVDLVQVLHLPLPCFLVVLYRLLDA